ncbi:MAG: dihydrodipicolinate synthase family protein, partial [Deltaproteobacteria bacterium]|nr:dihydrodipicolinate synthase family protein [Deltaproteobacteria bacterium]
MPKFSGIIAAMITPFDSAGEVYFRGVKNEINYLSEEGVKNIFACGSYGAFPVMTFEQRVQLCEVIVKAAQAAKMTTIIQVGSTSTKHAVQLAQHAESVGADAVSAVVPFYYSSTIYREDVLLKYFEEIIKSVSSPVHCYNNPNTTGFNVSPIFLGRLIDAGLTGIKDGGSDMGR